MGGRGAPHVRVSPASSRVSDMDLFLKYHVRWRGQQVKPLLKLLKRWRGQLVQPLLDIHVRWRGQQVKPQWNQNLELGRQHLEPQPIWASRTWMMRGRSVMVFYVRDPHPHHGPGLLLHGGRIPATTVGCRPNASQRWPRAGAGAHPSADHVLALEPNAGLQDPQFDAASGHEHRVLRRGYAPL